MFGFFKRDSEGSELLLLLLRPSAKMAAVETLHRFLITVRNYSVEGLVLYLSTFIFYYSFRHAKQNVYSLLCFYLDLS